MADFDIELDDVQFRKFFDQLNKKMKGIDNGDKKYLGIISSIVFKDVMDHFSAEQGLSGPWAAWSDAYAEHMRSIGKGGNKLLQDTGHLRQSFKPTNVRKVAEGYLWYNNAQTKSGFAYAAAHDEGGGQLPQRSFMWLSTDAQEDIAKQTLAFILDES